MSAGGAATVDAGAQNAIAPRPAPPGTTALRAPTPGKVLAIDVAVGDRLARGQRFALLEAMKMEHVLTAELSGIVRALGAQPGAIVDAAIRCCSWNRRRSRRKTARRDVHADLDALRADLAEVLERRRALGDEARADAHAKRRAQGRRTAREQLAHLFDDGEFLEYGEFALAAQRRRRDAAELERMSPADGLIAGIGHVNGDRFDDEHSRCVAMAYDYTVFAGTQGYVNHLKTDRMLGLAQSRRLPLVMYAEGGGGRPGRHRRHVGVGPRGADVRELRAAERPRAGRRRRVGLLLRGQRGVLGLLRRDHRDARREHRHGRPGDDRRRRPRYVPRRKRSGRSPIKRRTA